MTELRIGMTTFGCDGGRSGIGQYVLHLLPELAAQAPDLQLDILGYEDEAPLFRTHQAPTSYFGFGSHLRRPAWGLAWYQTVLPLWCLRRRYDLLFIPEANRRLPIRVPCPTVGTVHDFSSIHMDGKYGPVREFYIKKALPGLVRRLTHAISVSECTRRDIVAYAGLPESRVTVIPHGVDSARFFPRDKRAAQDRIRARYGVAGPYILYISRIEHPGKNHAGLIDAFARLKAQRRSPHRLVLAGSDWTRAEEVHRLARACPCADDIVFLGHVPGEDLADLYSAADLFVFPSRFEGFGMPLLEAMACGVPVACSNVSSMPEVAGDAAAVFSPDDSADILFAMARLLEDESLRDRCVRRGLARAKAFNWTTAARRTADVIRATAAGDLVPARAGSAAEGQRRHGA